MFEPANSTTTEAALGSECFYYQNTPIPVTTRSLGASKQTPMFE